MNRYDYAGLLCCCAGLSIAAAVALAQEPTAPRVIQLPSEKINLTTVNGWTIKQQDVRLTWKRVTTRVNGTTLPLAEIGRYVMYRLPDDPTYTNIEAGGDIRPINAAVTSLVVKQPACTSYHYAIQTIDTKGLKSPLSEPVTVRTGCNR